MLAIEDKIPTLRLRPSKIMRSADCSKDLLTYDSDLAGTGYISDHKEILILTISKGYLRIKMEYVPTLIKEMENIYVDSKLVR